MRKTTPLEGSSGGAQFFQPAESAITEAKAEMSKVKGTTSVPVWSGILCYSGIWKHSAHCGSSPTALWGAICWVTAGLLYSRAGWQCSSLLLWGSAIFFRLNSKREGLRREEREGGEEGKEETERGKRRKRNRRRRRRQRGEKEKRRWGGEGKEVATRALSFFSLAANRTACLWPANASWHPPERFRGSVWKASFTP